MYPFLDETQLHRNAAFYTPFDNGIYQVTAGLHKHPTNFGNGIMDNHTFQIDSLFPQYHNAKLACRTERITKYVQQHNLSEDIQHQIAQYLITTLTTEYPHYFQQHNNTLNCTLTQETIHWYNNSLLTQPTKYLSLLDALASQVQEDISILCKNSHTNWISYLHLSYPNHWSTEEKIGKTFQHAHNPVAGFQKANPHIDNLINAIIQRGPYVRFAWGITTDTRLNHHPIPPIFIHHQQWPEQPFNPDKPKAYLRIERQTLHPFPELQSSLFTIRPYLTPLQTLSKEHKTLLIHAIQSMTPEQKQYKRLQHSEKLVKWLEKE